MSEWSTGTLFDASDLYRGVPPAEAALRLWRLSNHSRCRHGLRLWQCQECWTAEAVALLEARV